METNSRKLLEAIPDFREFMALADEIRELSYRKMMIERYLKDAESQAFRVIMTDERFFNNGKPVSVSYFENAYRYGGIDNELLDHRKKLADIISELEKKRMQYDIYKQMLEVWRTQSANERIG